jgi:hypothetical protein
MLARKGNPGGLAMRVVRAAVSSPSSAIDPDTGAFADLDENADPELDGA